MSEVEKPKRSTWGGKRLGAGRPKKGRAKAPPPGTPLETGKKSTDKPAIKSAEGAEDKAKKRLGFKDIAKKPSVTILSKTRHMPVPVRLVLKGNKWVPEAGPRFLGAKVGYKAYEIVDPETTAYESMPKFYREYRRDALVRACVNALAYYATCKRFETQLQPTKDMEPEEAKSFLEGNPRFKEVKDEIDKLNKRLNLDNVLFVAIIKAVINGVAGFEIVWQKGKLKEYQNIVNLLPLDRSIKPTLDEEWNLTGFDYKYQKGFYEPEEVLYFPNLALEGDRVGLSDIEPVMDSLISRRTILEQAIPEAATVLWTGVGFVQMDTTGMADADADALMTSAQAEFKPGKWQFVNQKVEIEVADLNPDLQKLTNVLEYLDAEVIGNFKVPRFLIGREKQFNRATAYAELEAFINGPIAQKQQWLARILETSWYTPLVREILGLQENEEAPIEIRHNWNKFSTADFTELLSAISEAYASGWINAKKAYDLAGFDPADLPKWALEPTATAPPPTPVIEQEEKPQEQQTEQPPPSPALQPRGPEGRFVTRKDREGNLYRYFWPMERAIKKLRQNY